ncbi:sugar phosphate isomerase/epimerase family protein [Haloarchaeobius sp. TZWSO28]|uniref:sugar phosphate isomerase/epimerase family protein n=1 Tax=Haloarchaeobius sp. TZWSO28 TaxID=3446119 RepID=UPI003EBD99E9
MTADEGAHRLPDEERQFVLTGFADEIAPDLETQLDVLEDLGISHLDLRNVDETNVLDFDEEMVESVTETLDRRGFSVSSIGSPIGKIDVTDDFEPHLRDFDRIIELADAFDTENIRLFSYYIPDGDDPATHRDEVVRRMRTKVERAADAGVTLLHENEKDIYGDTPERCRDLHATIDSPHFRAIFDPANYLEIGVQAYPDALLQVVEFVDYLHIKDAKFGERGEMRPAGEGDGNIEGLLRTMRARGFHGFASLEPHLLHAGERDGYSGPDGFTEATMALKAIIDRIEGA